MATAFAAAGCSQLVIVDINKESLAETHRAILALNSQAKVLALDADVANEVSVKGLIDNAMETFHRIDYLVQCAGVLGRHLRSHETPLQEFDRINNINYRGSWLVSRGVLAHMITQEPLSEHPKQRGAIVHIASQLGLVGKTGAAPYCSSKAAVISMTRSDAIDYSPDGIRINCVCPGIIATPMTMSSAEMQEAIRPAIPIAPMNRMGSTDEIAGPVLFLCSADASFIQGHALVVDGGYTIN